MAPIPDLPRRLCAPSAGRARLPCHQVRAPPPHLAAGGSPACGPRAPGGSLQRGSGERDKAAARALGAGRHSPPLPAALGRFSRQPSSEPASASQGGAAAGGGEGGARRGREAGKRGGRGGEEDQRAPGSWSFCSAWPGFNAQQQRAAAAAGSPGAPAAAEPARPALPPANFASSSARGPGRAREAWLGPRPRSAAARQRLAPPPRASRGAAGGSRGPLCPGPSASPGPAPAGAGAGQRGAADRGGRGVAAAAQEARRGADSASAVPGALAAPGQRPDRGEHGRCGVTPPCPLGIKDIQPAGVGTKGAGSRVATAAPEELPPLLLGFGASGISGKRGAWKPAAFPDLLLDIPPTLDAAGGAVKSRRLWISPSASLVSPVSSRLGGVFALVRGWLEEAATRAHTHTFRGGLRGSGPSTICRVTAALQLKQAKRRLQVRSRAGEDMRRRYPKAVRSPGLPRSQPPHARTHTHARAHTHVHIGTRRAFAPVHVPPGHPRSCGAAGAGISRVLSPLTLWDSDFANRDFRWDSVPSSPSRLARLRQRSTPPPPT